MSVMQRNKGARYERHIADVFTQAGYVAHRSAQHCGKTGDAPDVMGLPYIHVECKHYKDLAWSWAWLRQAQRDAKAGAIPVVIHKVDHGSDHATLTAIETLEMLTEYYVSTSPADLEKITLEVRRKNQRGFDVMSGLKVYEAKIMDADTIITFSLDEFIKVYREYEASRYLSQGD